MTVLNREILKNLYIKNGKSATEIGFALDCSTSKINYWLTKYKIEKRSISDAVYRRLNPGGDPFKINKPVNPNDLILFGMGLGLYWGEGTKADIHSVRLGNSDPYLIKTFILFLDKIYGVKKDKLKFGLQIFSNMKQDDCLKYWCDKLGVNKNQFYKIMIKPSVKKGTYTKRKIEGVITIYYNNVRLRNEINDTLKKTTEKINIVKQ